MEIYLDNSATTRCSKRVQEIVLKTMDCAYGNPSSMHTKGMEAEQYVKEAASKIAKTLKVQPKEIFFTSGGTESNNLAIIGAALANRRAGSRIVTTKIEHASVRNAAAFLKEQGFEVVEVGVGRDGILSLEELVEAVDQETILVSIMQVNNEIGAVQPIAQAASVIRQHSPNAIFHVDAVQSYGKMRIFPKKAGIDLLSISGHKIHGPKGIGCLYIKENTKIKPLMLGGGQQSGIRSGTHNVPGIAGLGEAALECYERFEEKMEHLYSLREAFIAQALEIEGVAVNGRTGRDSAPHIVSIAVRGVRSEVLLHALEEDGIYVSAGAACSSNKPSVSHTLQAIGLPGELLGSVLRFSFSVDTCMEDIAYTIGRMRELVPKLRKYARH